MESHVFASSLELTVLEIETADVFIFKFFITQYIKLKITVGTLNNIHYISTKKMTKLVSYFKSTPLKAKIK